MQVENKMTLFPYSYDTFEVENFLIIILQESCVNGWYVIIIDDLNDIRSTNLFPWQELD